MNTHAGFFLIIFENERHRQTLVSPICVRRQNCCVCERQIPLFLLCICITFSLSCHENETMLYPLSVGGREFYVELADSDAERRQGLMHRQSLAADSGMLFVFPDSQHRSFWMRNTYINLTIAYIDSEGIVIDIIDLTALDETPVLSSRPVQYALEVNRGALQGIYPEALVDFSRIPKCRIEN